MRNKKYYPLYIPLAFAFLFIICLLLAILGKNDTIFKQVIGIIGACFSLILVIYHLFSYIIVTEKEIIIKQGTKKNVKEDIFLFHKTIIPINEVFMIDIAEASIQILTKTGQQITFKSGAYPKQKELVKLFEEIRQEVIEKTKQEEKTN